MTAHTEDGRRFLRDTDTTYDLIILDAYQKDRVPIHLTQLGFMELAESASPTTASSSRTSSPRPAGPAPVLPGAVQRSTRHSRRPTAAPRIRVRSRTSK